MLIGQSKPVQIELEQFDPITVQPIKYNRSIRLRGTVHENMNQPRVIPK